MPKTTATAIENLQIFRTIFRVLSILRRDFMVPLVFVKNIQNLCLVIKNVFFKFFNVVSFSSSDFPVPTNMCKKIPLSSDFTTVPTDVCKKIP